MRRWFVVFLLALLLLLTGCSADQGHYAIVYPYTVTADGQEFTFHGYNEVTHLHYVTDAGGDRYYFRRFKSGDYRVIEIHYPDDLIYTWKEHLEDASVSGEYTGTYDADTHIAGPVLIQAIQTPVPEMEYVPPQKTPLNEKSFPWVGLLLVVYGILRLTIPGFDILPCYRCFHRHWHVTIDDDPSEDAIRWAHMEGTICAFIGVLFFLHYFFF